MADSKPKPRVIVLHGAHGGPETNWFPWLGSTLESDGINVLRPRFPTPDGQSLKAWLDVYDRAVAPLPPAPTILVGHSLGAALALRVVERAAGSVAGLFLAAPFLGPLGLANYDAINRTFFEVPFDWTGIRERKGGAFGAWAGDDDPYVPLSRSREVAALSAIPLEIVPKGGHLNGETGFVTFPALRDAVLAAVVDFF